MDAYRTHSGQYEPEQDPGGSGHWNPIFRPDSEATMRSQEQSADTFLDSAEASHPSTGPPIATPLRSSEEAALARNISTMSFQAHAWHVEDVEEAREAQKGSDPHHAGEDGLYQDHADQDSQDRSHGSSVSALVVENPSLQGAANGHQPAAGVVNGQNIGDEIPAQVSDDEPVVTHIEHAEVENHPEQPFRSRPKHESFARTVSHDIPWADSDEAEPTGTSTNLNFDAFSGTGEVDSSNAFPDIHPVSQSQNANSTIVPPESVEDNSIEDVIWDPHQTKNAQEWDLTNGGNVQNGWGQDQANLEEMFDAFGKTGSENTTLLDAEARYEEGIPLIPHTSDVSEDQGNVESIQATDGVGGWGESGTDDFFSQQGGASTENQGDSFIPQPLDRKSTSQVLDSLNFRPHHETHDDPSNFDRRQSIVGGGVAVTTSTVISQIVEETKETAEGQVVEAKEEDLTAMWKAALDDDEFLDDTTEKPLDPSAFFEDDGEGFLEDIEPTAQQPTLSHSPDVPRPVYGEDGQVKGFSAVSTSGVTSESSRPGTSSRYIPAQSNVQSQPQPPPLGSPYTPSGPQFSNTQSTQNVFTPSPYSNFGTPSTQAPSGGAAPPWTYGAPSQPQQARPTVNQSESFVAKSKDGYSSPYDLPMEVLRPRKQPSMQRMTTFGQGQTPPGAPPLRSSSFGSRPPTASAHPSSSPNHPPTASTPSNQNFPQTAPPANQAQPQSGALPPSAKSGSPSSFFEELPVTAKPHRPSSSGRYTPQSNLPAGPPQQLPPPQIPRQQSPDSYLPPVSQQLQAPPKIDPYANVPLTQPPAPAPPVAVSRYSPAPPPKPGTMLGSTPASNRYAAPPRNSSQTPPFQPRTSSPLAHSEVSAQSLGTPFEVQSRPPGPQQPPYGTAQRPASRGAALRSVSNLATPMEEDETALDSTAPALGTPTTSQSPVLQHRPPPSRQDSRYTPSNIISTAATVNSQVLAQAPPQADLSFPPPRRSQTQSPGQMAAASISTIQSQRPVSSQSVPGVVSPIAPTSPVRRRQRGPSQTFNYIVPTDGREQDPLDRWKGCPIFNWGIGGTVITSFPRQIPRYNAGQAIPMMKISPGEVNVRQIKDILPLADHLAKFPGPLRSKGKKKEVVTWMKRRIDDLSRTASVGNFDSFNVGERQRLEEKTLLWQILCALVENDGQLDGSPTVVNAVRNILSPEMASDKIDPNMLYSASSDIPSISASSLSKMESENIDPDAINELRKFLLQGEREKAVWHAVDKRLWAHALLVSSTSSKDIWKQVVQEFVRQEIKSLGENAESMAALYQIFAGNWEESIDELVPPSARAGFQFVNTGDTGSKRDALEGLNKWKETLSLVVNNRVPEDGQALIALGKLLMGYGRVEAAHTCFMFARPYSVFSSSEDPQTSMALIGADHLQQPFDFGRDMDAILLSEIYEFALSLSAASGVSSVVPHLQAYKLNHAITLAEYGYRNEAKEYCDAIFSSIKSSTKLSPYYNVVLLGMLDELNKRLQNSPKDGSSSWFSRPSMKVSESVWSKFNNFVAGEESDTASTGSGKGNTLDVGPFAGIAPGSSPAISRTASAMDLYSMYPAGASGHSPPTSRYAPNGGAYAPRSSMEQSARSSNEYSRSPYEPSRMSIDSQLNQYSSSPSETIHNNYQPKAISSVNRSVSEPHPQAQTFPSAQSFTPYQPSAPELASPFQPYEPVQYGQEAEPGDIPVGAGYERPASEYQPPTSSYEPPSYEPPAADDGYMPPTDDSMYKPPSYAGPEGDNDAGEEEAKERPKKKSFMDDDDDDFAARAEALKREEKARKDREADEAVLKAAEADAQRDKQPPKSSWFGGWFGKKESNELGGPIKAKLGEENSFYYDPDLKKWVNKRAGGTPEPTKATPPPPKGPPSRSVSAGNPPMLGTPPPPSSSRIPSATMPPMATPSSVPAAPQRTASPTTIALTTGGDPLMPPAGRPPISRPTSAAPPSGPPSRPATSMSNASSIDDLLGAPTARKGGTVRGAKGKKGSRYVDVMAK